MRSVIAHYVADLQSNLGEEVAWDERALAAYASVADQDLEPIGIPSSRAFALTSISTSATATSGRAASTWRRRISKRGLPAARRSAMTDTRRSSVTVSPPSATAWNGPDP